MFFRSGWNEEGRNRAVIAQAAQGGVGDHVAGAMGRRELVVDRDAMLT